MIVPLGLLAQSNDVKIEDVVDTSGVTGWDIAAGVAVLVATWPAAVVAGRPTAWAIRRVPRAPDFLPDIARRAARVLVLVVGLAISMNLFGVSVGWFTVTVGVVVLVAILMLRPLIQNLAAGLLLETRPSFEIGDEIETNAIRGEVIAIDTRCTVIQTRDWERVHIPNTEVLSAELEGPFGHFPFGLEAGVRGGDPADERLTAGDIRRLMPKKHRKTMDKRLSKARSKDSLQAFSKLAEPDGDGYQIKNDPPLLHSQRHLASVTHHIAQVSDLDQLNTLVREAFQNYAATLGDHRRLLLSRYPIVDWAIKVVGVGSAGTRCFVVLLLGRQERDPLFLQVKEATASVLDDHLPPSEYETHGRRVVEGQRLMQAASDAFLGWSRGRTNHYYWRQLRDMKGSAAVETYTPRLMASYARLCGWTMARAHARSGDPVAMASYMGSGTVFDRAITEYAARYADQNDRDYRQLVGAIESGQVAAAELEV